MFKRTLYSEIVTIAAPRDWVWSILIDTRKYGDWNPFTYRVDTTLTVGDPVDLYVRMPVRGDRLQTEYVTQVVKPAKLAWGMTMGCSLLLRAEREQLLTQVSPEITEYQTWDAFSGLLTPLVIGLFEMDITSGFNAMAVALKLQAEKTWQNCNQQKNALQGYLG